MTPLVVLPPNVVLDAVCAGERVTVATTASRSVTPLTMYDGAVTAAATASRLVTPPATADDAPAVATALDIEVSG